MKPGDTYYWHRNGHVEEVTIAGEPEPEGTFMHGSVAVISSMAGNTYSHQPSIEDLHLDEADAYAQCEVWLADRLSNVRALAPKKVERFSRSQYLAAIEALTLGMQQLSPDGNHCAICGCDSHQAFECGYNPLVAITLCRSIALQSNELHNTLHLLAGFESRMGVQQGPAKIILPAP